MIDTSRSMLYRLDNLNTENTRISYQTSTGKVVDKGSEDSRLYGSILHVEDKIRVTDRLIDQVGKTLALNSVADSNMSDLKKSLDSIKTNLLESLNAGMDRSDKLAVATNLKGTRENIIDLVNATVNGEYIFSGSDTSKKTIVKDKDYSINGQVEFGGDGFLRQIAVQPGSYRDRGITAYDASFYTTNTARAGESFTFSENERIIDENGHEWKLNVAKDKLQQYDHNGLLYDPPIEIDISSHTDAVEASGDDQAVQATYTIDNIGDTPTNRVFEAKHNYFDDLNVIINALEGFSTKLDGTKANEISDEAVRSTLSNGLEQTSKQFDATNIGHGELGGRNKVFEVEYDRLEAQSTHYNILMEEINGADLAKLAMESKSLELTYQSLYSTISKMNNLSLVNYIK
jgi:flagellar hook-associated protein 3 FlgL